MATGRPAPGAGAPMDLSWFDNHQHERKHRSGRSGWLRAAVLGANDGIVSTASLVLGVAASDASRSAVMVAGSAGLVAGALSMAAGEFVSVSSQRDAETAETEVEAAHHEEHPELEWEELVRIYQRRGLDRALAEQVATRLMEVDPVGAHLRDELGLTEHGTAHPVQAAAVSAGAFAVGGAGPLVAAALAGMSGRLVVITIVALGLLALSGAVAGRLGGASERRAAIRVLAGGALAMGITMVIGGVVGTAVG